MKPKILFMGTPAFAVPALQALLDHGFPVAAVVCQPDRPQGRHMQLAAPPVKQRALQHSLPVLQPDNVRTPEFAAAVRDLEPDLIITAAYGRILPPRILEIPPRGCLNIHASLLPAYRGASPIQACLIHGERETGVTFMLMDEGMDTGDILHQVRHPVGDTVDAGSLTSQLADLGARELPGVIAGWMSGRLTPQPQDNARASYAPVLTRDSGLIDWDADASTIHNLIRGTTPWPGAFTWCGHKRLKIHAARVCKDPDVLTSGRDLAPGTICRCGQEAISIVCGRGILDLLEVQAESGKRIQCRDCAHNYRLGQRLEASSDAS